MKGEYELPVSKYSFSSSLFEIWKKEKENGKTRLLICSKDGFIRYWSNISMPTSFVDSVIPLNGDQVTHISTSQVICLFCTFQLIYERK